LEDINQRSDVAAASNGQALSVPGLWFRLCRLVSLWQQRFRERYQLAHLNDHMLRDIRSDRVQVWQEARKWFWHL
jgi:uncharacterized protein YjiS (DUF1127 family)